MGEKEISLSIDVALLNHLLILTITGLYVIIRGILNGYLYVR